MHSNVEHLLERIRRLPAYQALLNRLSTGSPLAALGLPRAARPAVVAALQLDLSRPVLLITDRADHAVALYEELAFWLTTRRFLFAEPNPLFYERVAWSAGTRRDRLQTLVALSSHQFQSLGEATRNPVVIASARAVMSRTLPPGEFLKATRQLRRGMSLQPEKLRRRLAEIGYARVNTVLEQGQFSSRGGILDLWPPAEGQPIRLDFFGEEIEALRRFDAATQRTVGQLDSILITPANEIIPPTTDSEADHALGNPDSPPTEFDIPLLHPERSNLLDYLPVGCLVLVDDLAAFENMVAEVEEQAVKFRRASLDDGTLPPKFPVAYMTLPELLDGLQEFGAIELGGSHGQEHADGLVQLSAEFHHDQRFGGRLKPFTESLVTLAERGETVLVVSRQSARLHDLWREVHPAPAGDSEFGGGENIVAFIEATLSEGFVLGSTHLISDSEIFGWERPRARASQHSVPETPEASYADLQAGDNVVHIDHGIGRYLGLMTRQLDGHSREFLAVEYEGGAQLFVPVHQADRLTRYVGAEGLEPALDRLGGQEWQDKKGKAKEAVAEVAQEMLELHARRQVVRGHPFGADTAWQKELEESFPYVETADQSRALTEIKHDMEAIRPMDRLLCGDVGYGKTELALRATFKAVMDGKQAAMLIPTTVLAQQHYETFLQRLAAFPVKVEMLSRFRSPREQTQILDGLRQGTIDIVVGTHRLISPDVEFKDLGLVIIDEEQRFGVTHKERLKQLRTEVDVLTLTATPIPRTLYMALTGVRDISNLNTPPEERLPIMTYVGPYSPQLARQAIVRELERGGQVFFVHNRVNTIDAMRMHLEQLVPGARVEVGHGQMAEHELADVMHRFNGGQTDILLSTTIIESGLDIPNANTLIVDRADTFGLSQLYQLRGRVGRGAVRAYAYFFRHRRLMPSMEAQQRLDVIAENTELGAGYSIAMRDLEIRGAGELLGTRQHGHIQAVGFHLYTRLLGDAVRQLRRMDPGLSGPSAEQDRLGRADSGRTLPTFDRPASIPVNVELPLALGIPADYIGDQELRVRLYRRLADIRSERDIDALATEFSDRFGPLPEMLRNLFYQIRVKLRAERLGLASIGWESGQVVLRYGSPVNGKDEPRLPDLAPGIRGGKGAYWCTFGKDTDWQPKLLDTLELLGNQ